MARKSAGAGKLKIMYVLGASLIIILGAFLAGIMINESRLGSLSPASAVIITIPFIGIVAVMVLFLKRQRDAVKSGIPLRDERTERADNRAGRYTTMLTIYVLLAFLWYQFAVEDAGFPQIETRFVIYALLFFMLLVFTGLKWYFERKGDK